MFKLKATLDCHDLNLIMKEMNCYYRKWFDLIKFSEAGDDIYVAFELDEQLDEFDREWFHYYEKTGDEAMMNDCRDTIKIREYLRNKIDDNVVLIHVYY
jgi:hypothetical protein